MEKQKNYKEIIENNVSVDSNNCWNWKLRKNSKGYGVLPGRSCFSILAHRMSWRVFKGEFDKSLCVCHICDNPCCVNPDHLFLGTQLDNMRDAKKKNRLRHDACYRVGEERTHSKLKNKDVLRIRELLKEGVKQKDISEKFKICQQTVSEINTRLIWKHI